MEMGLDVSQPNRDVLLITVVGDVDVYTAPTMRDRILKEFADESAEWCHVALDLSRTVWFDSTALGVTVLARKKARRRDPRAQLAVVAPPGHKVDHIMRITGLVNVFRLFPSLEECVAGLPAIGERPAMPA